MLLAACLPGGAQDAADYPNRPIRVIVPVGAGAGVDTAARITAEAVEKHLGQRFVIENKPGAGQRLGAAMVAKAPADGYTLLFTAPSPIVVAEHFPQKLDFEPAQDFQPVAVGVLQPALLVVRPNLGVKSVDEFVAYAKNNPGKLSFGIQGLGGEMHLSLELFKKTAGFTVNMVPYNVASQAIVDLLADRLDAMFLVVPPIKGHLDGGRLTALATLNGKRISALPNVPTMAELGRPEMTGDDLVRLSRALEGSTIHHRKARTRLCADPVGPRAGEARFRAWRRACTDRTSGVRKADRERPHPLWQDRGGRQSGCHAELTADTQDRALQEGHAAELERRTGGIFGTQAFICLRRISARHHSPCKASIPSKSVEVSYASGSMRWRTSLPRNLRAAWTDNAAFAWYP